MTNTNENLLLHRYFRLAFRLVFGLVVGVLLPLPLAGCGPTFDSGSLIENTRVIGARIEVEGAPDRASPKPGETADVTWLVTSPDPTPLLGWTFAVCAPAAGMSAGACLEAPLTRVDGTTLPPRIAVVVPAEAVLGDATSLTIHGGICAGVDAPLFDPQSGLATCPDGGRATTVSLDMPQQRGDDANHNPIAERAFTFDGAAWPALAGTGDPCLQGLRVPAGSQDHVIGNDTAGSDREPYTVVRGAPGGPSVATSLRESLQISQFTTAGKLKSQFSFVEATDENAMTIVAVTWDAPKAADVPVAEMAVTFTFVVRDDRGGTDWTTRRLCVTR